MKRRFLSMLAVAAIALGAIAATQYVPRTDTIFIRIGCQTADGGGTGTCQTTQYFLSHLTSSSTSVVGNNFEITPINYVLNAAGESTSWRSYAPDTTLPATYVLRADDDIEGQMYITGPGGVAVGLDATLRVRVTATNAATGQFVAIGEATVAKQVAAQSPAYEFTIDIPDSLEKVEISGLTFEHNFRGVHAGTNGWMDGNSRSWLDLPYYEVITTSE